MDVSEMERARIKDWAKRLNAQAIGKRLEDMVLLAQKTFGFFQGALQICGGPD